MRPAHTYVFTEKKNCKRSPVGPSGQNGLKIIFALLIKVVAAHVQLSIVHIWYFSLKRLLALHWRLSRFLIWLQISLHELFEQFLRKMESKSQSGNGSKNQNRNQSGARCGITRRSKRSNTQMGTVGKARVPGKLIFHMVNVREIPIRGTTRTKISGTHLDR